MIHFIVESRSEEWSEALDELSERVELAREDGCRDPLPLLLACKKVAQLIYSTLRN